MREAEIRVIGETTYELKPLATSTMLKLMAKLVKILGPAAALLDNPAQVLGGGVGRILVEISERLDDAEVISVCMTLAEHTQVIDGDRKLPLAGAKGAQWETHFAGDPVELLRWLGTALEVNFGPLASLLAEASKHSPSLGGSDVTPAK